MKRIIFLLCLLTSIAAQAQFRFGVKGGINVSRVTFDKSVFETHNRAGFFIGPTLEFTSPVGLGCDLSVLYDNKGIKVVDKSGAGDQMASTLQYVDVPINLRLSAGIGKLAIIFLTTGPQVSFRIGDEGILEHNYRLQDSDFSWNFGAGLRILRHYQLSYTYNMGISTTADLSVSNVIGETANGKLQNNTHQITFGYYF